MSTCLWRMNWETVVEVDEIPMPYCSSQEVRHSGKYGLREQKLGLEERSLMTKNDISGTFQSRVSQNQ